MRRRTTAPTAALALAGALLLGACSAESDAGSAQKSTGTESPAAGSGLEVSGAFVPEPVNARMAGGFLTVANSGTEGDKLVAVTSDLSDDVQIHETVDGKMRQVKSLDVPAGGKLELRRGGDHLMFMELKKEIAEGDTIELELRFEKADPVTVEVPVEARTHNPHSGH